MILFLKKRIPFNIKEKIKYFFSKNTLYKKIYQKEQKKIIVTLAADYGNMGDVAITYTQVKLLQQMFPRYEIIELPLGKTYSNIKSIKKVCSKDDIITIIGGGHMGDIYIYAEYARRFVVKKFKHNKIISFPQTFDFSDTNKGKKELKKSIKVYSGHKNLHLFARESKSYELMKKYFIKNSIYLTPDIVLSMNYHKNNIKKENIIICLRNDKEKYIDYGLQDKLINSIKRTFSNVIFQDTHVGDEIIKSQYKYDIFFELLNKFLSAKVVITDRLHGMIFCAITKTPCVVLKNNNHKIVETYTKWLKNLDYIKLIEKFDIEKIIKEIKLLSKMKLHEIDNLNLEDQFITLKNILRK